MKLVEEEGKKIGVEIILEDIMVDEKMQMINSKPMNSKHNFFFKSTRGTL